MFSSFGRFSDAAKIFFNAKDNSSASVTRLPVKGWSTEEIEKFAKTVIESGKSANLETKA